MSRLSRGESISAIGAIITMALLIGFAIWWNLNYKCVNSHFEWRTECTVRRDSKGKRTGETCHEHRVDVCDEWVER